MIKTQNLVPEVYYNHSRDFQFLGRVYDIVFNYLKTNSDTLYNNPYSDDVDDKLVALVSTTLGFKQTHEYNTQQLKALCSTFVKVLRNKGNINSIEYLLNLLANVEANTDTSYWNIDDDPTSPNYNPYLVNVYIPLSLSDTSLFEDMLTYVLPAGMSYRIVRELLIEATDIKDTIYVGTDRTLVKVKKGYQYEPAQIVQQEAYSDGMSKSTDIGYGRLEDAAVAHTDLNGYVLPKDQVSTTEVELYPNEESPESGD